MRTVYIAQNLIDAHLVRHALEDAGLPAFVIGEHLLGGAGELPLGNLLEVRVPEGCEPAARAVIAALALGEATDATGDATSLSPGIQPA